MGSGEFIFGGLSLASLCVAKCVFGDSSRKLLGSSGLRVLFPRHMSRQQRREGILPRHPSGTDPAAAAWRAEPLLAARRSATRSSFRGRFHPFDRLSRARAQFDREVHPTARRSRSGQLFLATPPVGAGGLSVSSWLGETLVVGFSICCAPLDDFRLISRIGGVLCAKARKNNA